MKPKSKDVIEEIVEEFESFIPQTTPDIIDGADGYNGKVGRFGYKIKIKDEIYTITDWYSIGCWLRKALTQAIQARDNEIINKIDESIETALEMSDYKAHSVLESMKEYIKNHA